MSAEVIAAMIGAGAGLIMAGLTMAGFWMALGGRIGKAEANSVTAIQVAAENEAAIKELARSIERLAAELHEQSDVIRREFGQTIEAMRTKIHEFETWSRDEFMRKKSFEAVFLRMERTQELRDKKIDDRFDRMENKLDEAVSALIAVSRGKGPNNTSQS